MFPYVRSVDCSVPWKTLGYYCTPSYKNIFGELCTKKKNLDFKDVLQSYTVAWNVNVVMRR